MSSSGSKRVAPYGAWVSPLSAKMLAEGGVRLREATASGNHVYWTEGRPAEGGRNALMRWTPGGRLEEALDARYNVRTLAHEYGGAAYKVFQDDIYFVHFDDQRLYRQRGSGSPEPITIEPPSPRSVRYADIDMSPDGKRVYCVREVHTPHGNVENEIVCLPCDGSGDAQVLWNRHDFVSYPRLSPDGRRLVWTCWNHPNMPWDGSELWCAEVRADGSTGEAELIAGGADESIFQPAWNSDGVLHFVSDSTGFWNLYRMERGRVVPVCPMDAEFGLPQWVFGQTTYAFLGDGRIVCAWVRAGIDHLGVLEKDATLREIWCPYDSFDGVQTFVGTSIVTIAASAREPASVVVLDVDSGSIEIVRKSREIAVDPGYLSEPESIEFPTSEDRTAHALFYAPANRDFESPPGELPPLLVMTHGGPTTKTSSAFNAAIQFWTSRGFSVVDVNYGGSTGYGRAYRERLRGTWGIVDVEDCVNAARYLAKEGRADGARLAIRGGSAGGYTTLCALTFHKVFTSGTSFYGIADCEALARDTHKFESRYLDSLIGPYPERRDLYVARSPIHHMDEMSCPLLILQGLEDKVVPPSQAEAMLAALARAGLPHAYLAFEGEQHGFRKAETIIAAHEAELSFYGQIYGFETPGVEYRVEVRK